MKRISIIGLCFAAVLAFGLMAVSGASAAEWGTCLKVTTGTGKFEDSLCNTLKRAGNYEFKGLTEPIAVESLGELTLEDMSAGTRITCKGKDKGTVGPGAADEITEIAAEECKFVSGHAGSCTESDPVTAKAVHLPWDTELVLPEGAGTMARDDIKTSGAGTPGWSVECTVLGIFKIQDTCEGETSTLITVLHNLIDAEFDEEANANPATCSISKEKVGLVHGVDSIHPTHPSEEHLLTVGPL